MPKTLFEQDYEFVFGVAPDGKDKEHRKAAKVKHKKKIKDDEPKKPHKPKKQK